MARKPKGTFCRNALSRHVSVQQGQPIFKDDRDSERYLDLLKQSQKRFGSRLYAYALMGSGMGIAMICTSA